MLEELWHDRVDIPLDEAKLAEKEMHAKKAAVTNLKKANQQKRDSIRKQATMLEKGVAQIREHEGSLAVALQNAATANAEADEQRAKTATHASAASRAHEQMNEAHTALDATKAECDALTSRLAMLHRQAAEEAQKTAAVRAEGDALASRLSSMAAQKEATAEGLSECTGWYETVNAVVKKLAGIHSVQLLDGNVLRYELAPPLNSANPLNAIPSCALLAHLDPGTGNLSGARLEVVGAPQILPPIDDLVNHAVRINSIEMLVREVQARLAPAAGAPPPPPPPFTAAAAAAATTSTAMVPLGAPASTRKRGGLAATPGRTPSGKMSLIPPPPEDSPREAAVPLSRPVPPPSRDPGMWSTAGQSAPPPPPSQSPLPSTSAAPVAMPVENLSERMATAYTPGGETGASKSRVEHFSAGGVGIGYQPGISAPPAAAPAVAPPAAADAPCTTLAVPLPMRIEPVESNAIDDMNSARHDAARRKSRKSFSRSVAHPRSPCARAARAGFAVDPRAVISEVAGLESNAGGPTREFAANDVLGNVRAALLSDGSVVDAAGELLAYIEADGTVGAPDLEYLGEVTAPNEASKGFVTDKDDVLIAEVDYGLGLIRDAAGSTIAALSRSGEVSGHYGARCGTLDGFTYAMLRSAAAYLTLVDAAFVSGK